MALYAALWLPIRAARSQAKLTRWVSQFPTSFAITKSEEEAAAAVRAFQDAEANAAGEPAEAQKRHEQEVVRRGLRREVTGAYVLGLLGIVLAAAGSLVPAFFPLP